MPGPTDFYRFFYCAVGDRQRRPRQDVTRRDLDPSRRPVSSGSCRPPGRDDRSMRVDLRVLVA